ncbi:type II toxin-antitoxin system RelE/ParE family toxin [Sphingomonas sp. PAMC 26621]|uniref:type II toxin-antitoxin system RelE/ParE family toxin n=1 Tax=Sphingomonas sp. PAMC 26621 TaxID=1112213 RepID=UPI001478A2A5
MSSIEWTGRAIADLYDIDDYWSAYSNEAAARMAERIEAAAAFLETMRTQDLYCGTKTRANGGSLHLPTS